MPKYEICFSFDDYIYEIKAEDETKAWEMARADLEHIDIREITAIDIDVAEVGE